MLWAGGVLCCAVVVWCGAVVMIDGCVVVVLKGG